MDGQPPGGVGERVPAAEIAQVQPRVGATARARLQWALDVARRDLDTLTVGDWANLQREFLAFCDFLITPDVAGAPWVPAMVGGQLPGGQQPQLRGAALESTVWRWGEPRLLPTKKELRFTQAQWAQIIRALLEPDARVTGIVSFTVEVDIRRLDGLGRSRMGLSPAPEAGETGLLQLASLLGAYAHLLRECPEAVCRRWFVATRQGQTFCGRTCQNRAAIREYRAAAKAPRRGRPTRGKRAR